MLAAAGWAAAPRFYSHYWVEGTVSLEGVPVPNRRIEVYRTPDRKIITTTDSQGRYRINLLDLQYFAGEPVTFETTDYTVSVPAAAATEVGKSENVLLRTLQGYLTLLFALFNRREGDTTPPEVTEILPPVNSSVTVGTMITITFSEVMSVEATERAVTLRPTTRVYYEWRTLTGPTGSYSVLYLIPQTTLLPSIKDYTLKIASTACDLAGNRLAGYSHHFSTLGPDAKDTTRPWIVATTPPDQAKNVALRPNISILFSEAMNIQETTAAVTLPTDGAPWQTTWIGGSKVFFSPGAALRLNQGYNVTVSAAARDLAGNPLSNLPEQRQFHFWTLEVPPDITPPEVIFFRGGADVERQPYLEIVFSEAMDPALICDPVDHSSVNIYLLDQDNNRVASTVVYEAATNSALLTPARLASRSGYTIVVRGGRAGVADLSGNRMEREYRRTMITADTAGPLISKVRFDGRGYVENDVIAADALVSAEVADPIGVNYNYLRLSLGAATVVQKGDLKAADAYDDSGLRYKISPAIGEGNYLITIEAADVKGNTGFWQGQVKVFTGDVKLVPGTVAFAAPATISPLKAQAAGQEVRATMVYNLTGAADIDLQLYGPSGGMVWARRYARQTMGGLAGYNAVVWNGRDVQGETVGNGIYAFRVVRGGRALGTGYIIVND